ncbi:hypothetical protein [Lactococcus fujiensis]|nr:hypothetical protein [Lactococcus fujiensis]
MSVFDDFERLKREGLPQILVIFGEEDMLVQEIKKSTFGFC